MPGASLRFWSFCLYLLHSWDHRPESLLLACWLRWGLMNFFPHQALNLWSSYLCLPSAGITGTYHHAWLILILIFRFWFICGNSGLPSYQAGALPLESCCQSFLNFFFFCGTGVWTQGLHLEPLHQPFFMKVFLR
jgi:hypothetical protein